MERATAIVLTHGMLDKLDAKTCHGLLRGSDRFEVLAVIDYRFTGQDAGEVMDGKARGIPIYASVSEYLVSTHVQPVWCVVGVALHGGILPDDFRVELFHAIEKGLSIVCGLHTFLSDDAGFIDLAAKHNVQLVDVRKPRPRHELQFWTGEISTISTPRIAVLGTDCAVGKRTTCRFLMKGCRAQGISAEMIYTGQTGWMQGYPYGFIFDSTVNDFIGGEIERAIVSCAQESNPDLILIEGQSALRNPSGPCGSEFLLSGGAKGVILQHAPARVCYDGTDIPIPSVASEIALIGAYGASVLAITLNLENMSLEAGQAYRTELQEQLGIPVILPLEEGVDALLPVIREFIGRG